jgi:hypothetical protein
MFVKAGVLIGRSRRRMLSPPGARDSVLSTTSRLAGQRAPIAARHHRYAALPGAGLRFGDEGCIIR